MKLAIFFVDDVFDGKPEHQHLVDSWKKNNSWVENFLIFRKKNFRVSIPDIELILHIKLDECLLQKIQEIHDIQTEMLFDDQLNPINNLRWILKKKGLIIKDPIMVNLLADRYYQLGEYHKTEKQLKQQLKFENNKEKISHIYYKMGICAERTDQDHKALTKYYKSYLTDTNNILSLYKLLNKCRKDEYYQIGSIAATKFLDNYGPSSLLEDTNAERYEALILTILENKQSNEYFNILNFLLEDEISICLFYNKQFEICYQLINRILERRVTLTENFVRRVLENRSYCLDNIIKEDHFLTNLKNPFFENNIVLGEECVTIFVLTDIRLIENTIKSFLNCCVDFFRINKWYLLDKVHDSQFNEKIKSLYPFLNLMEIKNNNFIDETIKNILHCTEPSFKYCFYIPDTYYFINKRRYLEPALNIFEDNLVLELKLTSNLFDLRKNNYKIEHNSDKIRYLVSEEFKLTFRDASIWNIEKLRKIYNDKKQNLMKIASSAAMTNILSIGSANIDTYFQGKSSFLKNDNIIKVKIIDDVIVNELRWNNIEVAKEDENDNDIQYYITDGFPDKDKDKDKDKEKEKLYDPNRTIIFNMDSQINGLTNEFSNDKFFQVRTFDEYPSVPFKLLKHHTSTDKNKPILTIRYKNEYPYNKRETEFLEYLKSSNFSIDIFNKEDLTDEQTDPISNYKYILVLEDKQVKNYFTEKLFNGILAECLTFYQGCPNIGNYIDDRTFIRLDLSDFEKSKNIMEEAIKNDEWSMRIKTIRNEKNKILHYLQLLPSLERIILMNELKYNFPKTFLINLDRRPDRLQNFKDKTSAASFTTWERFSAVDGTTLAPTEEIKYLFRNNDFNYRRTFIGCALSHLELWRKLANSEDNVYLILEDDIDFSCNFVQEIYKHLPKILNEGPDLCYLGYSLRPVKFNLESSYKYKSHIENVSIIEFNCIGGIFAYTISKNGAKKLLQIIDSYGIGHGIDYLMMLYWDYMDVRCFYPPIVFTDYVGCGKKVDSDIQYDVRNLF